MMKVAMLSFIKSSLFLIKTLYPKKITIQSSIHKKHIKKEIKIWKLLSKFSIIVELIDFQFT